MQTIYLTRGESLDYKNETGSVIEYGTVIAVGTTRIGVAAADIPVDELGAVHVEGVFKMPKSSSEAIAFGDDLYWDDSVNQVTKSTKTAKAGYAVAAAAESDEAVYVKLLG